VLVRVLVLVEREPPLVLVRVRVLVEREPPPVPVVVRVGRQASGRRLPLRLQARDGHRPP